MGAVPSGGQLALVDVLSAVPLTAHRRVQCTLLGVGGGDVVPRPVREQHLDDMGDVVDAATGSPLSGTRSRSCPAAGRGPRGGTPCARGPASRRRRPRRTRRAGRRPRGCRSGPLDRTAATHTGSPSRPAARGAGGATGRCGPCRLRRSRPHRRSRPRILGRCRGGPALRAGEDFEPRRRNVAGGPPVRAGRPER